MQPMPMDITEKAVRNASVRVAAWCYLESKRMAEEGKTAKEITEHLRDLKQVIVDWRQAPTFPPNVIPWEWKSEDVQKYVTDQKPKWLQERTR
jgi:hypothetical protein